MENKKYKGYGYHGGGRPRVADSDKVKYKTVSICGTPAQIADLKQCAEYAGLSVSRFVLQLVSQYGRYE